MFIPCITRGRSMFNEKKSPAYLRKLRMQRAFILGLNGLIGCGIIAGYLDFHNRVARYTQSVAYRETQEATKEYTAKLMRQNKRLLLNQEPNLSPKKKFDG